MIRERSDDLWILSQSSCGIGSGQSSALSRLHHAAMAVFGQSYGREYTGDLPGEAPFKQPPALTRDPEPGVDEDVCVYEDPGPGRNGVEVHWSKTSNSMLSRSWSGVR